MRKTGLLRIGFVIMVALISIITRDSYALDSKLSWTSGKGEGIAGYRVFNRKEGESYDYGNPAWEGGGNICVLHGLDDNTIYYFVARAFSTYGLESINSNEVRYMPGQSIRKVIAGLGDYPSDGGWMEIFSPQFTSELWLKVDWPEYNALNGEARVAVGDIDGDDKDEIIIGLGPVAGMPDIPGGRFQILDDDYTLLMWGEVGWPEYNSINGETWPACGDIDGDGDDEIIIGLGAGGGGAVEVFNYSSGGLVHLGWVRLDWDDYNKLAGETRPAAGDVDGDGKDEIVVGLGKIIADETISTSGVFCLFDDDFAKLSWGQVDWPDYNQANGETRPSCGDLDGDGIEEVVIGLGNGGQGLVEIITWIAGAFSGSAWASINWDDYKLACGETRPFCSNIDQDIKDEVIVGLGLSGNGRMVLFDDASAGFSSLMYTQTGSEEYNAKNGETWPAVMKGLLAQAAPEEEAESQPLSPSAEETQEETPEDPQEQAETPTSGSGSSSPDATNAPENDTGSVSGHAIVIK
ncbi:MAG: hypothetical protein V1753_05125, partial [Pseudomonadota bacterium]